MFLCTCFSLLFKIYPTRLYENGSEFGATFEQSNNKPTFVNSNENPCDEICNYAEEKMCIKNNQKYLFNQFRFLRMDIYTGLKRR